MHEGTQIGPDGKRYPIGHPMLTGQEDPRQIERVEKVKKHLATLPPISPVQREQGLFRYTIIKSPEG